MTSWPPESVRCHSEIEAIRQLESLASVSRETGIRLACFVTLLQQWQSRINLVAPSTMSQVWRRHILDSAQLVWHVPADAESLIDLGSGAGFPGLILACLTPVPVTLIEADGRKASFLRQAARIMGLAVTVEGCRIESVKARSAAVITARALAPLPKLLDYTARFWRPGSMALFAKGRRVDQELTAAAPAWNMAVERLPSVTDPDGVILRLQDLVRRQA